MELMTTEKYILSFTAGGLLYRESIDITELYLALRDWKAVKTSVHDSNLIKSRTMSSSIRICREILLRLALLNDDELNILIEGSWQEQLNILWLAICRRHRFIYDFAVEVVREKYLRLDTEVRQEDYYIFFNAKADWHPELEELSDSTRGKLRQVIFRMMREAEVLNKNNTINPGMLTPDFVKTVVKHSRSDLTIFPASDLEIRELLQ